MDDFHQLLGRLNRLELQYAYRLLLDLFEELAGEGEIDVGFEQDAADLAHPLLDIGLGQDASPTQLGENVAEFVC